MRRNNKPTSLSVDSTTETVGSIVLKDVEVEPKPSNPIGDPIQRTDWVGKQTDGPSVAYMEGTAMGKMFRDIDGNPQLTVIINGVTEFTILSQSIGDFYGLNEQSEESFGSFAYDLLYRLDNCMYGHSFHILKCDRTAKFERTFTYNVMNPSESVVGPIVSSTDYQHSGFTVHPTEHPQRPHIRHFSVYGVDEVEIEQISEHYRWFVEGWEETVFGSSDVHYHWLTEGKRNQSERHRYAVCFFDRYHRMLNGEAVDYPISFDVWGMSKSEIAEAMEDDIPF